MQELPHKIVEQTPQPPHKSWGGPPGPRPTPWSAWPRQVFIITAKDLRAELRTKEAVNAALAFAVMILVLFSFAFDPEEATTKMISGGLLWIVFAFAGTLVLNRSFARELPNDCLDALVAAPVSGAVLFLGKALANYLLVIAVELVALPVFGILYNVRWYQRFWQVMLVLALGTWGITVIGTIFSALTVNIRLREVMLPMITYPMLVPALMGAMQLTVDLVNGKPIGGDSSVWLKFLIGFDVIYTAASLLLVETVLVG
jgi:heme exporter protein B